MASTSGEGLIIANESATSKPTPWLGQGSVCPLITSSTVPCSWELRTRVVLSPTPSHCLAKFTSAISSLAWTFP